MKNERHRAIFQQALAPRRKQIKPEELKGAAKHLYKTMNEAELVTYTREPVDQPTRKRTGTQIRSARSY